MKLESLKALNAFLVWRYEERNGQITKVPYCGVEGQPVGTSGEYRPRWTTYAKAQATCKFNKRGFDGMGFVFDRYSDNLYICGIDIDHADPDSDRVRAITAMFPNAYIEASPSGEGVHIVLLVDVARIPTERVTEKGVERVKLHRRYYCKNKKADLECYIAGLTSRYFTFTGKVMQDGRDVDQTDAFLLFLDRYMVRQAGGAGQTDAVSVDSHNAGDAPPCLSDDAILTKARAAANGAKFAALYDRGDLSGYDGDDSAADMGLLNLLAFWTGKDPAQMERLFSMSALGRRISGRAGRTTGKGQLAGQLRIAGRYTSRASGRPPLRTSP